MSDCNQSELCKCLGKKDFHTHELIRQAKGSLTGSVTGSVPESVHQHPVKSLIKNNPSAVYESLLGNAMINKHLVVLEGHCIIVRRDHRSMSRKVKIIGGGGAGIEPADSYYVGKGMLTAAVVGEIFTAPPVSEILVAIKELRQDNNEDILLLVKNYIGDKLNFQLAKEAAVKEKINVKMLLIGDDIFPDTPVRIGRKGVAGSVLVYKILGEMAEQGKTLNEIIDYYQAVISDYLITGSATLVPCLQKNCENLGQAIKNEEMVLGLGVNGKGGNKKVGVTDAKDAVAVVLNEMITFCKVSTTKIMHEDLNIVALVNNLGATTKIEEGVLAMEVQTQLIDNGFKIARYYVGSFMSILGSQGFSITLLSIDSDEIIKYLSAPTTAPAWPRTSMQDLIEFDQPNLPLTIAPLPPINNENILSDPILSEKAGAAIHQIVLFAAEALISCEMQLNIIDMDAGDGDTGTVFSKIAEAIKKKLLDKQLNLRNPGKLLFQFSEICGSIGGLSGGLYYVFFKGASKTFLKHTDITTDITPEVCCTAFNEAVKSLKCYSKAHLGDRTILDALVPALDSFVSAIKSGKNLARAVYLAATTCEFKSEETKFLKPSTIQHANVPLPVNYVDPGTHAASIWLRAVTFDTDPRPPGPGIFIWKFIDKEESNLLAKPNLDSSEILMFFEKKLGAEEILLSNLLKETVNFAKEKMEVDDRKISALVGTVYYTHKYFTASKWRKPAEVYFYFRESILRQSVESAPISMEIFEPEEAKEAIIFFFETYVRNLPIISILHSPNYTLHLKTGHTFAREEEVKDPLN